MAEKILEIRHLQKHFGRVKALKDVSFEINQGEIFGFIGPNGAGKSTTIRVLLGILKANGGQATLFDQDVWQQAVQIHRRIAYVPGDVYLWPNLSGGEIIDLFLKLNHQQHTSRTDDLIAEFQLDPSKKAGTYSKGNRQKVALIAAFSTDADFYLFDEPTSGLDPLMENTFQKKVLALKAAHKTVLLSSHLLSEVEKMCDRIAIIRQGRIIETGSLAQMRHLTRTQFKVTTKLEPKALNTLPGLHDLITKLTASGYQSDFNVEAGALTKALTLLAAADVLQLTSMPPTLEDLFMHYYRQEEAPHDEA